MIHLEGVGFERDHRREVTLREGGWGESSKIDKAREKLPHIKP